MAKNEITVDVEAKLHVSRATAEACLHLVQLYVNDTGINVIARKLENGELDFEFEDKK